MRKMYMKSILKTSWLKQPGMKAFRIPVLIMLFMLSAQIINAQGTTMVWQGNVSTNAVLPANWNPQLSIVNNTLQVDSAKYYTNAPVVSVDSNISVFMINMARTASFSIDNTSPTAMFTVAGSSSIVTFLVGTYNISGGELRFSRNITLDDSTAVINISGTGKMSYGASLLMSHRANSTTFHPGGTINISDNGVLYCRNMPIRFDNVDTTKGIIVITDNGLLDIAGNVTADVATYVKKAQIRSTPDRDIVAKYKPDLNRTHVYSRDKMAFVVEPETAQKIVANQPGTPIAVVQNDGWKSMVSFEWKYSTTSGSGYVSFSPAQTNDTIVPVLPNPGAYYLVCVGNNGTTDVTSNEVQFVIASDKVSIAPAGKQKLRSGQIGSMLTVTETETATSREWLYSTTSGSGYVSFSPAQTGTEYTPDFVEDSTTYYVICRSVIGGINHPSNEVEVEVVATNAPAFDMIWKGETSEDVDEMTNWFPIAQIEGNNLFVDTPYVHAPVLSSPGRDNIAGFDVQDGASFTLDKPSLADTLHKAGDWYLYGELIVHGGVFDINGRLRLEANTPKVVVTGGKIVMSTDFIVGTSNFTAGAEDIIISGDGVIDAGAQIWRWASDSSRSDFTITDDGKLFIHADFRGEIFFRIDSTRQIRTDSDQLLVVVYPYIVNEDTMTLVYAKDTAAFAITPTAQQIIGVNEEAAELSTLNSGDKIGFEWKYTTTSGDDYVSFDPVLTDATCKPMWDAAGTYYVICEAYSLTDTVMSNEVELVVVSVAIAPADMQTIIPAEEGAALTVTESLAADARAWKYSTTSGSGYTALPGGPTGATWTPLFVNAGVYYVICESSYGEKTIRSNEVTIRIVTNSIAPAETQEVAPTNAASPLTVTESIAADSRLWKYTETSGQDYVAAPGNPTGTSWAPVFDAEGFYYVVCVSVYGTLEVISNEVEIDVIEGVSVENLQANDILLYPNPAAGKFYVSSAKSGSYTVYLIDMQGRLVLSREFNNATGEQMITVNQTGMYFVKIITGDSVSVAKIIIE
jgi:hypothetical protein